MTHTQPQPLNCTKDGCSKLFELYKKSPEQRGHCFSSSPGGRSGRLEQQRVHLISVVIQAITILLGFPALLVW